MKTVLKIVIATATALPTLGLAQTDKQMLSLEEAIAVTLTENPALKAAEYEERAAQQERRAAIGLRMPQINVTGAYAYLGKDIGVDFNNLKDLKQRVRDRFTNRRRKARREARRQARLEARERDIQSREDDMLPAADDPRDIEDDYMIYD